LKFEPLFGAWPLGFGICSRELRLPGFGICSAHGAAISFRGMKTIALLLLFGFAAPTLIRAETTEIELTADPAIYGEYPKNYKEIILKWLETKLADPNSAQIEWTSAPKPADLPEADGKRLHGYLVEFKVSARNRFGAYTGKQRHGALIRDGNVIKGTGFGF
jgi:hypothetical protein